MIQVWRGLPTQCESCHGLLENGDGCAIITDEKNGVWVVCAECAHELEAPHR